MGASFGATLAGCLALVATTGAAVYFFMKRKRGDDSDPVRQIETIFYEEIHRTRELVTIRKPFTAHISFNDDRKIFKNVHMPFSGRKLFMEYSGMIVCGCDLREVRFVRDENAGNRVKILVPRSKILDCYADVHSFKVHYQDTGLLAKDFQINEQNDLIKADLASRRQQALQDGTVAQADAEIKRELLSMIERHALNQSFDVEIVFLQGVNAINAPQN